MFGKQIILNLLHHLLQHILQLLQHILTWMIVGPRKGHDPPPGRRRDAAPRGHLADKLFKEGTPPRLREGPSVMEGGEMGEDPCVKTPSPSPTTLRSEIAVALGQHKCFPRR